MQQTANRRQGRFGRKTGWGIGTHMVSHKLVYHVYDATDVCTSTCLGSRHLHLRQNILGGTEGQQVIHVVLSQLSELILISQNKNSISSLKPNRKSLQSGKLDQMNTKD